MRLPAYLLLVALALTGCTSSMSSPPPATTVITDYTTSTAPPTRTTPPAFTPKPATTMPGLRPGAAPPAGFVEAACPYLATLDARNLEGNRIYRVVISTAEPTRCRFYYYCCQFQAVLAITPTVFATATEAYNAMVVTGAAGKRTAGVRNLASGVDGVLFQTRFFAPDGDEDWACAFAKSKTMVVVQTNQTNVSLNARRIAQAVAPKF